MAKAFLFTSIAAFESNLTALLMALATVAAASDAIAGSSSVGTTVTFDRDVHDLGEPKSAKIEFNASHTFDTGIILAVSVDYSDSALSDSATDNLEGTIGYRLRIDEALSMTGSAGIGERFQAVGPGDDFSYYVLRAAVDLRVGEIVTWNAAAFRYRDAFDSSDDYLTPQLATGVTFKIGEHGSISSKVQYNWKDWNPGSIGFSLGYKYAF